MANFWNIRYTLIFSSNKSMEVFGGWENYHERIKYNWENTIAEDDYVILAGDISWATYR